MDERWSPDGAPAPDDPCDLGPRPPDPLEGPDLHERLGVDQADLDAGCAAALADLLAAPAAGAPAPEVGAGLLGDGGRRAAQHHLAAAVELQREVGQLLAVQSHHLAALLEAFGAMARGDDPVVSADGDGRSSEVAHGGGSARAARGALCAADELAAATGQAADEVAAALGLTTWSAQRAVERSAQLHRALPHTLVAVQRGQLDWARAGVVADATALLADDDARAVDRDLFGPDGTGAGRTTPQLRARVDEAVHRADARALARRARTATAERRVRCRALPDGQAQLSVVGPAPAVHELAAAVRRLGQDGQREAAAGRGTGDPWDDADGPSTGSTASGAAGVPAADRRGLDAHSFDALRALLTGGGPSAAPVVVEVRAHLSTLLGEDDLPGRVSDGQLVPAWLVRRAARSARLRRVLTDPLTGQVVAVDGHCYPPGWDAPDPPAGPAAGAPDAGPPSGGTSSGGRPSGSPPSGGPPGGAGPGPGGVRPGAGRSGGARPGADQPAGGRPGGGAAPARTGGDQPAPHRTGDPSQLPSARDACPPADTCCPVARSGGGPHRRPVAVDRLVRAVWQRCTHPGCGRPAAQCDVDHVVAHPDGPSCPCNLAPLCRRHHLAKHGTPRAGDRRPAARWVRAAGAQRWRWRVEGCGDGHLHWTSPLGHRYAVAPPPALLAPSTAPAPAASSAGDLGPLRYGLEGGPPPAAPAPPGVAWPDGPPTF